MTATAAPLALVEPAPVRHLRSVPTEQGVRRVSSRPVAVRPSGARRPGGLTRRGRLVLTLLGVLLLACVFVLGRSTSSSAAESGPAPTAVVGPGQTLWTIAEQVAPDADPRRTVATLAQLNHLSASDALVPGQVLTLPRH